MGENGEAGKNPWLTVGKNSRRSNAVLGFGGSKLPRTSRFCRVSGDRMLFSLRKAWASKVLCHFMWQKAKYLLVPY